MKRKEKKMVDVLRKASCESLQENLSNSQGCPTMEGLHAEERAVRGLALLRQRRGDRLPGLLHWSPYSRQEDHLDSFNLRSYNYGSIFVGMKDERASGHRRLGV